MPPEAVCTETVSISEWQSACRETVSVSIPVTVTVKLYHVSPWPDEASELAVTSAPSHFTVQ